MPNIPKPDKETLEVLAAAGYPDPGPPGLIEEGFPEVAKKAGKKAAKEAAVAAVPGLGAAVAGYETLSGLADATQTKSGISQYLIGSGGAQQSDTAPTNAILSALNRLAGFKSRL